jgi:excisionase family DNA binding protein
MSDESHDIRDNMTVAEAARMLGITEGAVRKRVERGKLAAEHMADGRLLVYLDHDATTTDKTRDRLRPSRDERYTRSLEDQVQYLRGQLDQERDANRENRRIIAGLTQRIPELLPARDSADPSEMPGAPETATPEAERTDGPDRGSSPETAAQRRPWWRRVFGG